ncbi:hypothetical protein I4U23_017699 [Adineta vaga]|nr:hypothetical protein I4U23_017699 [Adineta vaga]
MNNMLMYSILFVYLYLIRISSSSIVQATTPVNQTCLNFGRNYDCRFYQCFEERFPCGSSYWMLKWGYKYCTRMQKAAFNFDKTGQDLIKKLSHCLINTILRHDLYKFREMNCDVLRSTGQQIVHDCYITNAKLFCQAYHGKNRDCFFRLTDHDDRHDLNVIRTLTSVGQKCFPKKKLADMKPKKKMNQCIIN